VIGNLIEASIATVTAGSPDTLTLDDVAGSPNFDDVFGASGTRLIRYTALQFADPTRATLSQAQGGIGSIDLATKIITQTLIEWTWSGTVYDNTAPAELTFTAGADTTRIYCAPVAEHALPTMPGTGNITGDIGAATAFGAWPLNINKGTGTLTATIDLEYWTIIYWHGSRQIDQATLRTGSVTTGNCKMGWYQCGPNGLPGQRIKDFGAFAVGGSGTNSTVAVSGFCPPPGWYWQAAIFDAGVAPLNTTTLLFGSPAGTTSASNAIGGYTRAGSYATGLPASGAVSSPTAISAGTNMGLPCFSYRMAA
jgi:hypothetical protein